MADVDVATSHFEIVITGPVDPARVVVRERATVAPRAGEVLVKVEATGVSYAEVQMLLGRYPGQPPFPFVPGYDVVGRIVALGEGVDPALAGQRVATLTGFGGWAEQIALRVEQLVEVPERLDAAEVDALIVNGLTAYKMIHRVARVRPGQTVVVLGAGGGVGSLLVQLARLAGAAVIGTCRAAQREGVEALGARVIDFTRNRVLDDVRALVPEGVDAVFDHVGGRASLSSSFGMLRPRGLFVGYGNASFAHSERSAWWGLIEFLTWKLRYAFRRRATFFDVWGRGTLGADSWLRPRRFWRELREDLGQLIELLDRGDLTPVVAHRLPLREAAAGLALHRAGGFIGKIVLEAGAR